jgi:RHH-type transcriptional regulator, rel operon repressor / antitoxin RelB
MSYIVTTIKVEVFEVATNVQLSPDVEARLGRLTEQTGRTKAFYLRELIISGLDRIEGEYDVLNRAEEVRRGEVVTISLAEAVRDFDPEI